MQWKDILKIKWLKFKRSLWATLADIFIDWTIEIQDNLKKLEEQIGGKP